jgi:hypothetical protein
MISRAAAAKVTVAASTRTLQIASIRCRCRIVFSKGKKVTELTQIHFEGLSQQHLTDYLHNM